MDKIFIHNDVENLKYFSNKHGISAGIFGRATHYAMQGSDIVRIFHNKNEAIEYYNKNRYRENWKYSKRKWCGEGTEYSVRMSGIKQSGRYYFKNYILNLVI